MHSDTSDVGSGRQARVGVQEQQHIARCRARAGIHLRRAPARRDHDAVAKPRRELGRAIAAAAIHDNDFMPARAQRCERLERGTDAARLVQRGDDDRKSFSDQS